MGPALGGTRIFPYGKFDDALNDVLRLSKGMTYKAALANVGLGGGKSVIIADPKKGKSNPLLKAFGKAVEKLAGEYICAEDVGCTTDDVQIIREETQYVTGLQHKGSSGNPAPYTAWGTFRGIQATLNQLFGSDSIENRVIAIQGLGSVGTILLEQLYWAGAKLKISDIDPVKAEAFGKKFGAEVIAPDQILFEECDILAPCALGGVINKDSISKLRCKAIAGCANNQLLEDEDGVRLTERGILYAPDFVINAGGLINVEVELSERGYDPATAQKNVHQIYDRILDIYQIAEKNGCTTNAAALQLAEYRMNYGIGKRIGQLYFHHEAH